MNMAVKRAKRYDGRMEKKITIGHDGNGKQIQKSFYGFTEKEILNKVDAWKLLNNKKQINQDSLFSIICDKWLLQVKTIGISYSTYAQYERIQRAIVKGFINFKIGEITANNLQAFLNGYANFSASLINKMTFVLRAIFKFALANKYITENPATSIKSPKPKRSIEKKALSKEQTRYVVDAAKLNKDGLGIVLLLKTGLRKGELLALKWKDIDLQERYISVHNAVKYGEFGLQVIGYTKNKYSERQVPIDMETVNYLKTFNMAGTNKYLFENAKGAPMDIEHWSIQVYKKLVNKIISESSPNLNLQYFTPHECRHTCGTLQFESGTDLYTIQLNLGHGRIEQTQAYTKNSLKNRKDFTKLDF